MSRYHKEEMRKQEKAMRANTKRGLENIARDTQSPWMDDTRAKAFLKKVGRNIKGDRTR